MTNFNENSNFWSNFAVFKYAGKRTDIISALQRESTRSDISVSFFFSSAKLSMPTAMRIKQFVFGCQYWWTFLRNFWSNQMDQMWFKFSGTSETGHGKKSDETLV